MDKEPEMRRMRAALAAIAEERDKALSEVEPIPRARLAVLHEIAGRKFRSSTSTLLETAPALTTAFLMVAAALVLIAPWTFPSRETTAHQRHSLDEAAMPVSESVLHDTFSHNQLTLRVRPAELAAFRASAFAEDHDFTEVRLDLPVRALLHDDLARTSLN